MAVDNFAPAFGVRQPSGAFENNIPKLKYA
jgi:hypothetical protein